MELRWNYVGILSQKKQVDGHFDASSRLELRWNFKPKKKKNEQKFRLVEILKFVESFVA